MRNSNQFKVGDRVKRVRNVDFFLRFGLDPNNLIVREVNQYGNINVANEGCLPNTEWWSACNFVADPLPEKAEYVLMLRNEHGTYLPAETPRVYKSEAQAKAVAASMAEKHAGQTFVIFKAVGKSVVPKPFATVEMF